MKWGFAMDSSGLVVVVTMAIARFCEERERGERE